MKITKSMIRGLKDYNEKGHRGGLEVPFHVKQRLLKAGLVVWIKGKGNIITTLGQIALEKSLKVKDSYLS